MSNIIKSSYVILKNPSTNNIIATNNSLNTISTIDNNDDAIVNEAYLEKEKILEEALAEAKKIVNSANEYKVEAKNAVLREIEEIKSRGYEEGYQSGMSQGIEEGKEKGYKIAEEETLKKNEDLISELCKDIYVVEESKDNIIRKYEKDIVKLSINIAEKITRSKLSEDESIIKNILQNAIRDYKNVEWVKIYLSSDDYITISTDKTLMQKLSTISEHVRLEVMNDTSDGELIIETPDNLIDAGVNTQINNLKNMVSGAAGA